MVKSKIKFEKVSELDDEFDVSESEEMLKADNNFELKKWGAEVWSEIPELNKDFTLSNLSDEMFNSRVVNFIRNRILLVKLLKNVFRHADRNLNGKKFLIPDETKMLIKFETIENTNCRNLILSEVYTILNLSKARGGLVLKSFLEGGLSENEMESIVGIEGPAIGEPIKRGFKDKLLGRNKIKRDKI